MRRLLGAVWSRPAAPGAEGPRPRDVVLVIAASAAAVLEGALRTDLTWPAATAAVTVVLLTGLPWRRSRPLLVVAGMTVLTAGFAIAQAAAAIAPNELASMMVLIAMPYALFRWGSGRDRVVGGTVLALGLGVAVALGADPLAGAIAGTAFVGGACLIGALRRERVAAAARDLEAVRAREREALARDLHDTVAHHVSAIAIRAQAAATNPRDAERVAESLAVIEREAQAVLTDMRSLVRTLRAPADRAPTAGLAAIARLAEDGPPRVNVRIETREDPPDIVASTVFRIAQEGVTNARRHATGATAVDVVVTAEAGTVRLLVHDDGDAAPGESVGGHGLRGIIERAALLGGGVTVGPDPAGGWTLRASIPVRGGA